MKTKTLYLYLLTLACLLPFGGCSGDDEIQTTPLASPSVAADQATASTLQFSWQAVPGAVQYAYQLHDAAGNLVQGDVTNTTSATFTQLTDNTTYTLTVWAYAAYGSEQSRSATVTLTATTLPILQLQAPQAQVQVDGGSVSVSWPAVADAGYYSYRVMDAEGGVLSQADTYDTSCSFSLSTGTYTFYVAARSVTEDRSDSPESAVAFTVERTVLYQTQGTFQYGAYTWDAVVTSYSGGSYSIASWYGTEGYDFNFSVTADDQVLMPDYYNDGTYIWLPTDNVYYAYLYDGYNQIERNGSTVTLWFYEAYVGDYCSFTWTAPTSRLTAEQLAGNYAEASSGYDYYIYDWQSSDYSFSYDDGSVTIEAVDDQTICLKGLFWMGDSLLATLDSTARTLTFAPGQTFATYYTFASLDDVDTSVVATVSEDGRTITLSSWGAWYAGYTYVDVNSTVLTRQE